MNPINALGLKISFLTAIVLLLLGGLYWGGRYAVRSWQKGAEPTPLAATPLIEAGRTDSDGDSLPDQFESVYQTDKNQADTDSDGTNDFDEILAGRDPVTAGEADVVKPITGPAVADQSTYTGKYLAQLPADVSREEILSQTRLEAFVNLNKGPLLPSVAPEAVKTTTESGKTAIETYLKNISSSHNTALFAVTNSDIEAALGASLRNQPQGLQELVSKLEKNVTALQAVAAPAEVLPLHQKLIAASQALVTNTKLLQTTAQDFVAGLIASKNIEELGPVFQEIATQIAALEKKYQLE